MLKIEKLYRDYYGINPKVVSRAPGRLEILGNHTDYNEGFVLSTAVEQSTLFAASENNDDLCRLHDFRDGSSVEFSLAETEKPVKGDWTNYIRGVINELRKRNIHIGTFNGAILSSIPLSAGMSSSAALEISAAFAFAKLFNIDLEPSEWARIGQGVENNFMGLQSGLLDQFSSIYGKKDSLILSDFRKTQVLENVPVPNDYVFVVVNSMVKHDLVDSDYNERHDSCEKAVESIKLKFPEINSLRDIDSKMLEKCRENMDIISYKRAKHVLGENERVIKGIEVLKEKNIEKFGKLMYESHESSRDSFENSCPELDYLVELSTSIPGAVGARLSGGGFGGISVHLVKREQAEIYARRVSTAFKLKFDLEAQTIICSAGDGASACFY